MFYSSYQIEAVMKSKRYKVFNDDRGYDLNIFGIRANDQLSGLFNDLVGVMYLFNGVWNSFCFPATTDPGVYWRKNPMNVDGTAILVPGQYRGAYKLGEHKGYPALQQQKSLKVYRDSNKDDVLDMDPNSIEEGMYSINIHRASQVNPSTQVGKWSAGCQVIQDPLQFEFLISLVRKSSEIYGNSFTYTLLTQDDF